MDDFTFKVKGTSLKQVKRRVQEHIENGATLIGEIKEEYYQSKNFRNTDYHHVKVFKDNYEKVSYSAILKKPHIEKENRRKLWRY